VDRVLNQPGLQAVIPRFGRARVTETVRAVLNEARAAWRAGDAASLSDEDWAVRCVARLEREAKSSLRPVFNLTGTVLHTNLGRALLPESAVTAVAALLSRPCNLEYDLERGGRGDRDDHVEGLVCELTGAEAATVVNNNAAAVFLALNTLALRKEVIVSRGELVEIGGSFRIPDIMARAGCKLREIGTTNRTHPGDFRQAIGARTALVLKVHASNYAVQGFTASVPESDLAELARGHGLPFMVDLGSGALVDLGAHGLPREPTPQETLRHGADIVTFSGDKLLGGPQAGIIAGRADLIARIRKNPLKRALRVDKMTLAALEAVLRLCRMPELAACELPTLRLLTRPLEEIHAVAAKVQPALERALAGKAAVVLKPCRSQIGSGALPVELLPSLCLAVTPSTGKRGAGTALKQLAAVFRALPVPVIGRIEDGSLCFDLRCLEDEAGFIEQLGQWAVGSGR